MIIKYNNGDKLTKRTLKIILDGGRILLKKDNEFSDGWYLSSWSNIAGGPDYAYWASRDQALSIFNLKWAFALAKLYECKVVVVYPTKKKVVPKPAKCAFQCSTCDKED